LLHVARNKFYFTYLLTYLHDGTQQIYVANNVNGMLTILI